MLPINTRQSGHAIAQNNASASASQTTQQRVDRFARTERPKQLPARPSTPGIILPKRADDAEVGTRLDNLSLTQDQALESAQDAHAEGVALLKEKRYAQAQPHLLRAVCAEPTNARYQYSFGVCFEKQDIPIGAEAGLRAAVVLEPNSPKYNFSLGHLLYRQRRFADAKEYLVVAADGSPNEAQAQFFAGRCLELLGEGTTNTTWKDAWPYYCRAVELEPTNPEYLHNLGWGYSLSGEPHKAINCFKNAIAQDPTKASYWAGLGRAYKYTYNASNGAALGKAADAYQRAMELEPDAIKHPIAAAECYAYGGLHWAEAEPFFRKAYEMAPNDERIRARFCACLRSLGRNREARKYEGR